MCTQEGVQEEAPVGLACALEGFTDADVVKETIRRLADEDIPLSSMEFCRIYDKFKSIIDQYCEQPHLLDKELQNIVDMSLDIMASCDPLSDRFHEVCKLLYLISKTRGYKFVRTHFPHEVPDIEKVLGYLTVQDVKDSDTWETHYILLLWLSILATVPFALARFDGTGLQATVTERFLDMCRTYIRSQLKCNIMAAYVAGCFLSRPDIHDRYMTPYLNWVEEELSTNRGETYEFSRSALLTSVCNIFKIAKREVLRNHSTTALNIAMKCVDSKLEFERKLALKLLQRIGLCLLSPNLAPWRYLMTKRGLLGRKIGDQAESEETYENIEVPEVIEQIVDCILTGLGDSSLNVRWSAAKGMGRIASRLPKNFAIEVVTSVFTLFEEVDRENLWQGGCIALAELGRRGVLLPVHLPTVVNLLIQALVYDELRGSCSVGGIVRDSACYVAWTLGRSYDPKIAEPFVKQLAGQMLCLTCFDREVHIRRAASAAFQECVGRLGNFPNGVELIVTADYFSVGNRKRSFLEVGIKVAEYKEYTKCVVDHLLYKKVTHWDKPIRLLAALTLHDLVRLDSQYFINNVYPDLFEYAVCLDYNMRHGALHALGQITLALSKMKVTLPEAIATQIFQLYTTYKNKKYFSSSMHHQMLGAFAEMIANLAESKFAEVPPTIFDEWWAVCDRTLDNPEEEIQLQGVRGMANMLQFLTTPEDDRSAVLLSKSYSQLHSESVEARKAHARFLGSLSPDIVCYFAPVLFSALAKCTQGTTYSYVESRKEALISLGNVVKILADRGKLSKETLYEMMVVIDRCLEDYSLSDVFCDVGLVVRLASANVFKDLLIHLADTSSSDLLDTNLYNSILCRMVGSIGDEQRASSQSATDHFSALLEKCPELIPHSKEAKLALSQEDVIDCWSQLLGCDSYREQLLVQLLMAVGAKTEQESTKAQLGILKYLQEIQDEKEGIVKFVELLERIVTMDLFKQKSHFYTSMARGVGRLLNSGILVNAPATNMSNIINYVWGLIRRTKNVNKIISTIEMICEMLQFKELETPTLTKLSFLLGHRHYPAVRMQTATKLYETLLMYSGAVPEENYEVILSLLSDTEWRNQDSGKYEEIRAARNHFCELVKVPVPVPFKGTN